MSIIISAISFLLTICGFLYGAFYLFRSGKPLYFKLTVSAAGCLTFARLSTLVNYLTDGNYYVTLGDLGVLGALLFLLSANFGSLNDVVDDGVATARYRRLAHIAPVVFGCGLTYIFCRSLFLGAFMAALIVLILLPMVPASYYSLKHILLPVDAAGFLKGTKACNLLALLFYASLILSTLALLQGSRWGDILSVFSSLFAALISVFAVRGERLWQI